MFRCKIYETGSNQLYTINDFYERFLAETWGETKCSDRGKRFYYVIEEINE